VKTVIASICSLVFPGLGQVFYGKFAWGLIWFFSILVIGPLANLLSAAHVLFLAAK